MTALSTADILELEKLIEELARIQLYPKEDDLLIFILHAL